MRMPERITERQCGLRLGSSPRLFCGRPLTICAKEVESSLLTPRNIFEVGQIPGNSQRCTFGAIKLSQNLAHVSPPRIETSISRQDEKGVIEIRSRIIWVTHGTAPSMGISINIR